MIDIVTDQERNLKNLKQIGTPREENKIYIENFAYTKLKENTYKDKRVFVLMGHTECMGGRYATFVEAVIYVDEIEFSGGIPRWNNKIWNDVFREIKRLYEDMIIVGWAIDRKGMSLQVSPELERVHREHFGGVHQLLFLLDSLEREEAFYMYKENKVIEKDGFYIYHRARKKQEIEPIAIEVLQSDSHKENVRMVKSLKQEFLRPEPEIELDVTEIESRRTGQYRKMLQEKGVRKTKDNGNVGLVVAAALLLLIIGAGIYDNWFGSKEAIETQVQPEGNSVDSEIIIEDTEEVYTEKLEEDKEMSISEDANAILDVIPVEVISGEEQRE